MINPKSKEEREKTEKEMKDVFNQMFKADGEDSPKPINMEIGEPIPDDADFQTQM